MTTDRELAQQDESKLSWGGFNLSGDKKSINEARRLVHCDGRLKFFEQEYQSHAAALSTLQEQLRACELDAKRYRWLRVCTPFSSRHSGVTIVWPEYDEGYLVNGRRCLWTKTLDAAIDAAILAESPKEPKV